MKKLHLAIAISLMIGTTNSVLADAHSKTYSNFPVTVSGYAGDKKSSESYGGQMARHVLHTSLKSMIGESNGKANPELKKQLESYFDGIDEGRKITSPVSKDGFPIKQTIVAELSKKKNLSGKSYKGAVNGWPGNMTGKEVLSFMLDKASSSDKGYDSLTAYDYGQLFSKTAMGAIFYNQAVDNYLDELLGAKSKPNDKPYSDGAAYTGKEHVWDEAFGYFGAPANAMSLDANTAYAISKADKSVFAKADANGDGTVDLKTEMTYGHAYYAADADKGEKTNYLHDITGAFISGRQLITDAKGQKLSDDQRTKLKGFADIIKQNWEQVIAEAAYKYAGSVYKDLKTITKIMDTDGDIKTAYRDYSKHWGELKGFALALQMSGKDLGETGVNINRLIGFSPVNLTGEQVTSLDGEGNYVTSKTITLGEYMVNMAKLQGVLKDKFALKAVKNEVTDNIEALSKMLGEKESAEND